MTSPLFIGKNLYDLPEVDSTNSFAARLLREKRVPEGTVIRAAFQTHGRGYSGNIWESEETKNLLISIILFPQFLELRYHFFLNQIASLAVAETVDSLLRKEKIHIKWPNDIIVNNQKIAGILVENLIQSSSFQYSIIGVGLNVNQNYFGEEIRNATSLRKISGKQYNLDEVMSTLLSKMESRYLKLKTGEIGQLQKDYMKKLYRIEEESLYKANGKEFNAKIVGLNAEGKLILETDQQHEVFGFKEVEMIL